MPDRLVVALVGKLRLNADHVIHGVLKTLLTAKIPFSGLYRYVAKQKLNLF
jgi:hypothetical protein